MTEATLSSKYQLVIPKEIREEAGLKSGEKIIILTRDGIITLVPQHSLLKLRGFVKGINIGNYREKKDRL